MELSELLARFNRGEVVGENREAVEEMRRFSREAQKITMAINTRYHEPEELATLFSELIGEPVGADFGLFPPFYTDFGKNIHIGDRVFINAGCKFQDQGGIFIGDGALIGHGVVLATLNHDLDPARRQQLHPAPIRVGQGVWIGAGATVTAGVTIGEHAVVGGVPAKFIKNIEGAAPKQ